MLKVTKTLVRIVTHAGDTIFSSPPNTRKWNSTYLQQKFIEEFNGTSLNTNLWDVQLCKSNGYGSFEARCFMPRGDHYYYAYWLWGPGGGGYPQDGFTSEIDITEGCAWSDGSHHNMKSTFHLWPQTGGSQVPLPDDTSFGYGTGYEGAWHIYKIVWSP